MAAYVVPTSLDRFKLPDYSFYDNSTGSTFVFALLTYITFSYFLGFQQSIYFLLAQKSNSSETPTEIIPTGITIISIIVSVDN